MTMSLTNASHKSAQKKADQQAACPECRGQKVIVRPAGETLAAAACKACSKECPECYGAGYLLGTDVWGGVFSKPCTCTVSTRHLQFFNAARIPRIYQHAVLSEFKTDGNEELRQAWLALLRLQKDYTTDAKGIGLSGKVGVGKSHLLAAFARDMTLKSGVATLFIEFTHLLSDIRAGFDRGSGEADVMGPLINMPILIIDELGKGLTTEWQLSMLDELISRRYNNGFTTCFSTNYPFDERSFDTNRHAGLDAKLLVDRVGERIFSRLQEMCVLYRIEGEDYRKRMRDQQK
jgi:DNA replication protein DnaC